MILNEVTLRHDFILKCGQNKVWALPCQLAVQVVVYSLLDNNSIIWTYDQSKWNLFKRNQNLLERNLPKRNRNLLERNHLDRNLLDRYLCGRNFLGRNFFKRNLLKRNLLKRYMYSEIFRTELSFWY